MKSGPSRSSSILSATRLHFPEGTDAIPDATVGHLRTYAQSTWELGVTAAVAVNCLEEEVARIIQEAAPRLQVKVLHVPVWGAFVPALNTLLGEAQRQGVKYILYQSLEVSCSAAVLRRLLDHFTQDTLVVGPVLDGHKFEAGEQTLNGRTTPWNTLALWSTRKLGLTGFLSIADGMPEKARRLSRQLTGEDPMLDRQSSDASSADLDDDPNTPTMGSAGWWEAGAAGRPSVPGGVLRQETEKAAIPAGVEEVTAIALLQHLLGDSRARAVLLLLPPELSGRVSWEANWGGDERRRQWHEYKMASKVTRPAAQIKQLFRKRARSRLQANLKAPLLGSCMPSESQEQEPQLNFGTVLHFGESIGPPPAVAFTCLCSIALFSANFASAFAAAFRSYNEERLTQAQVSLPTVTFVGLLIGGVYIPMPLSLWLTRYVTSRADHIAGLALFSGLLLCVHMAIFLREANGNGSSGQKEFLLCMRLLQGLGSGVLFQARFVLASLSTQDQHQELQAWMMFAGDLGLGVGALLPWAASAAVGESELSKGQAEKLCSFVLAVLSLLLFVWTLAAFPWRLHRLPDRVRFQTTRPEAESRQPIGANTPVSPGGPLVDENPSFDLPDTSGRWRTRLLVSGTTRIFVQSAVFLTVAMWMRDVGLTGCFRQTKAIAALCLLPAPFEALASGICCPQWMPRPQERARLIAICTVVVSLGLFACTSLFSDVVPLAGLELLVLLVALAVAAPRNVSRLYQLRDAEQSIVTLEWLKAYIGRLVGPIVAIAVQNWIGYEALLSLLCAATVVVALTA